MFKHRVETPFESTRNRCRLVTMICTLALLGNVEAASLPDGADDRLSQIIFPSPLSTATIPGAAVTLDVMYDTLPQDETLTGIGVRVHFDSSKLSFDQVDQTLAFGRLFSPELVEAEADTVTSSPAGIVCGEDCLESYSEGTIVTLTATSTGDSFVGWSGDCSGTDTKATLTMNDARSCNAEFATQQDLVFADGFE